MKKHSIMITDDSFDEDDVLASLIAAAKTQKIKAEVIIDEITVKRKWRTVKFTGEHGNVVSFLKERAHIVKLAEFVEA